MEIPPFTHLIYIPAILLLGAAVGFVLGRKSIGEDVFSDEDLDDF